MLSASIIAGLGGASVAGLKAWNGWLELKKMELTQVAGDRGLPPATGRIEIADLRERVRKLEAIAAGSTSKPPAKRAPLPRRATRGGSDPLPEPPLLCPAAFGLIGRHQWP